MLKASGSRDRAKGVREEEELLPLLPARALFSEEEEVRLTG